MALVVVVVVGIVLLVLVLVVVSVRWIVDGVVDARRCSVSLPKGMALNGHTGRSGGGGGGVGCTW